MKKPIIVFFALPVLIFIAFGEPPAGVSAAAQDVYCGEKFKVEKKYPEEYLEKDKYWKYTAEKTGPNFVLDYYQDPDLTGVSITVTIETAELMATTWKWETRTVCQPYGQAGAARCRLPDGGGYGYLTAVRVCAEQPPITTYRSIDTGTVAVRLDPDEKTRDLLGPGPTIPGTKKPVLSYLYPDLWTVVVVRGGDRKIIESKWVRNPPDVEAFLLENKEFEIFESADKGWVLNTRMSRINSPTSGKLGIRLVQDGQCKAGLNVLHLDDNLTAVARSRGICDFNKFTFGKAVNKFVIPMTGIPLDVPGQWSIGVGFDLLPARFGDPELSWPGYPESMFSEKDEEDRYTFESFVLRSAPCNPEEPGGCWSRD